MLLYVETPSDLPQRRRLDMKVMKNTINQSIRNPGRGELPDPIYTQAPIPRTKALVRNGRLHPQAVRESYLKTRVHLTLANSPPRF